MKPIVSYQECMRDSPKFRDVLEENHANLEDLESKLEKVLKNCNSTIDAGKTYLGHQTNLVQSLLDVSLHFRNDPPVTQALNKIANSLQETVKYHSILIDQAARSVSRSLNNFLKKELKEVKESRQRFDKISADLDTALVRHAQAPKNSTKGLGIGGVTAISSSITSASIPQAQGNSAPVPVDEAANVLIATRSCFRYTALDHVHLVSMIQSKKRHELLDALLSYMHAQSTFFHQGSDLFADVEPFLKNVAAELSGLREETIRLEKTMENRHGVVTSKDNVPMLKSETQNGVRMEGYLFKRTTSAFKTWNRRWFSICSSQLMYRKRTGDPEGTVMEHDLKLCSVRPMVDIDRRYCFEVISPTKSHVLQADSEEMFQIWITALQDEIGAALQLMLNRSSSGHSLDNESPRNAADNSSYSRSDSPCNSKGDGSRPTQGKDKLIVDILSVAGNEKCADCSTADPEWASINLGITLCIACSGIHRSLGVHVSKVRSLRWDKWDSETVQVMLSLGNGLVNSIYEAKSQETKGPTRPHSQSPQAERDLWIQAKYVKKLFVDYQWNGIDENGVDILAGMQPKSDQLIDKANWLLSKGSETGQVPWICRAFALNADRNIPDGSECKRAPVHLAVQSGSVTSLQYLLLNGAKINVRDEAGKTALLLATELGLPAQVGLLLKSRADQNLADNQGNTPLEVAVQTANADIVSFLRISRLTDEMRETEFGEGGGDDTFHEMVRDFLR